MALAGLFWALTVVALLWAGVRWLPPLADLEGLGYDARVALLPVSGTVASANRDVLVVRLDEASLRDLPYRDPVDRRLIADLIDEAAAKGARAIGIAMSFADGRDTASDATLIATLRDTPLPVAIGIDPDGGDLQTRLLAFAAGGLLADSAAGGDAARVLPMAAPDIRPPALLNELALMIRAEPPDRQLLRYFGDNPPPRMSARDLETSAPSDVEGRVVIIDPARDDRLDPRLDTAMSLIGAEPMTQGTLLAYGLRQLIGGPRPALAADWQATLLLLGSALLGLAVGGAGWRSGRRLAAALGFSLLFAGGAALLFSQAALAIPLMLPLLAFWLSGLGSAFLVDRRRIGRRRRLIATHGERLDGPALRVALSLTSSPEVAPDAGHTASRRVSAATVVAIDAALAADAADWLEPRSFAEAVARHRRFVQSAVAETGGVLLHCDATRALALFGGFGPQPDHAIRALRCLLALRQGEASPAPSAALGTIRAAANSGPVTLSLSDDRSGTGLAVDGGPVADAQDLLKVGERLGSPLCATAATVSEAFACGEGEVSLRPVAELRMGTRETLVSLFEPIPEALAITQETKAYYAAFRRMRDLDPETPYLFRSLHERSPDDRLIAAHLRRLTSGGSGSVVALGWR